MPRNMPEGHRAWLADQIERQKTEPSVPPRWDDFEDVDWAAIVGALRERAIFTEEEKVAAQAVTQPFRKIINKSPALTSLLYDLDLLPEQIVLQVNALRMIVICELMKGVS